MARHISLQPRKFQIELLESSKASVHGGQLVILGLLQQSGFLERIVELPALDPRKDKNRGFDPEVYLAAVLFSFCTGGTSLSDVEELGKDRALMKLLGIQKIPDQCALGEWLRALDAAGLAALARLNHDLCQWILRKAPKNKYCYAATEEEWFFDDSQIEVTGKKFEAAAINYNGDRALGWQTLWRGPLIVACQLGGQRGVGECFSQFCQDTASMRQEGTHYLYTDSGSSDGADLQTASVHFTRHSISYNKWLGPLQSRLRTPPAQRRMRTPLQQSARRPGTAPPALSPPLGQRRLVYPRSDGLQPSNSPQAPGTTRRRPDPPSPHHHAEAATQSILKNTVLSGLYDSHQAWRRHLRSDSLRSSAH